MKYVAVLLTVYNRKEKTLMCLKNLYAQQMPEDYAIEVFLTNDGCTDGTPDAVKEQFPFVTIINAEGSLFWNRGMYTAWKKAAETRDYDFYMWLNDDTFLYSGAIISMMQCSDLCNHLSIIVGTTCAIGYKDKITYGGWNFKVGLLIPTNKPFVCDYFNGNIVLFPRSVYQKVGTNDPAFRHALGDFDYGLRARKLGVLSIVAPDIQGECNEHITLPVWCNPNKSLRERWEAFRSPLGQNPEESFIYENRHNGLLMACFHYFTNHLRVFFPRIWKKKVI